MTATATAPDLAHILEGIPKGAWVAISSKNDRVLNYGSDMRKVLEDAKKMGEPHPLITRVPEGPATLLL